METGVNILQYTCSVCLISGQCHNRSVFRKLNFGNNLTRAGAARYWHCHWSVATLVDSVCQCKRQTLRTQLVHNTRTQLIFLILLIDSFLLLRI